MSYSKKSRSRHDFSSPLSLTHTLKAIPGIQSRSPSASQSALCSLRMWGSVASSLFDTASCSSRKAVSRLQNGINGRYSWLLWAASSQTPTPRRSFCKFQEPFEKPFSLGWGIRQSSLMVCHWRLAHSAKATKAYQYLSQKAPSGSSVHVLVHIIPPKPSCVAPYGLARWKRRGFLPITLFPRSHSP